MAELTVTISTGRNGYDGWIPVFAVVADGNRRVQQVVDWTSAGSSPVDSKPAVGQYVGAAGMVDEVADAAEIYDTTEVITARNEALGYRDEAEGHKDDAETASSSAGSSATSAGNAATTATTRRDETTVLRDEALGFRDEAEGHKDDAETASSSAGSSATTAGNAATTATTRRDETTVLRDEALGFRDEAEGHKDDAESARDAALTAQAAAEAVEVYALTAVQVDATSVGSFVAAENQLVIADMSQGSFAVPTVDLSALSDNKVLVISVEGADTNPLTVSALNGLLDGAASRLISVDGEYSFISLGGNFLYHGYSPSKETLASVNTVPTFAALTIALPVDAANNDQWADTNVAETGTDTDLNGDNVTYAYASGNANSAMAVDSNTGIHTVNDNTQLGAVGNVFNLVVNCDDTNTVEQQSITVNIAAHLIEDSSGDFGSNADFTLGAWVVFDSDRVDFSALGAGGLTGINIPTYDAAGNRNGSVPVTNLAIRDDGPYGAGARVEFLAPSDSAAQADPTALEYVY